MAFDLVATMRLNDRITGPMRRVQSVMRNAADNTRSLTERMGGLTTALGAIGVTVGLAAVGKQIVEIGANFDEQMAKVKAITGATDEQFGRLAANARQLGKDTKFSMTEAAEGQEKLALIC